jgi:hypothetical protein
MKSQTDIYENIKDETNMEIERYQRLECCSIYFPIHFLDLNVHKGDLFDTTIREDRFEAYEKQYIYEDFKKTFNATTLPPVDDVDIIFNRDKYDKNINRGIQHLIEVYFPTNIFNFPVIKQATYETTPYKLRKDFEFEFSLLFNNDTNIVEWLINMVEKEDLEKKVDDYIEENKRRPYSIYSTLFNTSYYGNNYEEWKKVLRRPDFKSNELIQRLLDIVIMLTDKYPSQIEILHEIKKVICFDIMDIRYWTIGIK